MKKRVVDIREIFPDNDNTLWYDIPGYPSYQLSNTGYVRSYKQLKQHPFGILKSPDKYGCYTLTDNNNVTCKLDLSELKSLVNNCKDLRGYTTYCKESCCRGRGRNQRYFIDFGNMNKRNAVKKPKPIRKEECSIFKFTIVPDQEERQIIKPIRFIK